MPKRITNEERIKRIDEHNNKQEQRISKKHEKELVRITKTFIKAVNDYNKNNLISK